MNVFKHSVLIELTEIETLSEFKILVNIGNVLHLRREAYNDMSKVALLDGTFLKVKETPQEVNDLYSKALLAL